MFMYLVQPKEKGLFRGPFPAFDIYGENICVEMSRTTQNYLPFDV
jgi:hypothetical protein